tara:strand:+ start:539 stop:832 length:294 start_codon:yes stop_codon:yes gene_type:complete
MNLATIAKHHTNYTVFAFSVSDMLDVDVVFIGRANTLVLNHMNVRNLNCMVLDDNIMQFIIGGDCSKHSDLLSRNIEFGLEYCGIENEYLGMVVHVS